jgi:hypothetical protein
MSQLEWILVLVAVTIGLALIPDWSRTMAVRFLNGECWRSAAQTVTCFERVPEPPPRPARPAARDT